MSGPADEREPAAPELAPARRRPLAGALVSGGVIVALAAILAFTAVPARAPAEALLARTSLDLSPAEGFELDLAGRGGRDHVALRVDADVEARTAEYATERAADPLTSARVCDAVLRVVWRTTRDDLDRQGGIEALCAALSRELEPLLFPVHVGCESDPWGADPASGLRPGSSIAAATMRGPFERHRLRVDAAARTIALDEGAPVAFRGDERDLVVADDGGLKLSIDVTGLRPGFRGEVRAGVLGRVRAIRLPTCLTD